MTAPVVLPFERYADLKLVLGEIVYVSAKRVRVFASGLDYEI